MVFICFMKYFYQFVSSLSSDPEVGLVRNGKRSVALPALPPLAGISQIKATHSSRAAQAGNGARWILMVLMTSGQMDYKLCTVEEMEAQS